MKNLAGFLMVAALALLADRGSTQESSKFEQAAQSLATRMPVAMRDEIHKKVTASGKSAEEAQQLISSAVENYSICAITAALDQGRSQGIEENAILDKFAGYAVSEAQDRELNEFDFEAWQRRVLPCQRQLGRDLGIQI